jgi:hypothetical protein
MPGNILIYTCLAHIRNHTVLVIMNNMVTPVTRSQGTSLLLFPVQIPTARFTEAQRKAVETAKANHKRAGFTK